MGREPGRWPGFTPRAPKAAQPHSHPHLPPRQPHPCSGHSGPPSSCRRPVWEGSLQSPPPHPRGACSHRLWDPPPLPCPHLHASTQHLPTQGTCPCPLQDPTARLQGNRSVLPPTPPTPCFNLTLLAHAQSLCPFTTGPAFPGGAAVPPSSRGLGVSLERASAHILDPTGAALLRDTGGCSSQHSAPTSKCLACRGCPRASGQEAAGLLGLRPQQRRGSAAGRLGCPGAALSYWTDRSASQESADDVYRHRRRGCCGLEMASRAPVWKPWCPASPATERWADPQEASLGEEARSWRRALERGWWVPRASASCLFASQPQGLGDSPELP